MTVTSGRAPLGITERPPAPEKQASKKTAYERLAQADKVLAAAQKLEEKCPAAYENQLEVAFNLGWERKRTETPYEEGIGRFPHYQYLHSMMAHYMLPEWSGDDQALAKFAERVAQRFGDEQYTRIVLGLMGAKDFGENYRDIFRITGLEWPRTRNGFMKMLEEYPESRWNVNYFAQLACAAGDRATAKKAFERIGDDYATIIWGNRVNFIHWKRWADGA